MNNANEISLFSRLSTVCAGISFFYGPTMLLEILGIILGIIGLLKQEKQKIFTIIGVLICSVRFFVALAINEII